MRIELKNKNRQGLQRTNRTRARLSGTSERPRLSVNRSNKYYSAQVIDDSMGKTLVAASTQSGLKVSELGKKIAELAKAAGVNKVVFDRGGMQYTGNLALIADGARGAGLEF